MYNENKAIHTSIQVQILDLQSHLNMGEGISRIGAHTMAGAIIPALMHRIPSELRS